MKTPKTWNLLTWKLIEFNLDIINKIPKQKSSIAESKVLFKANYKNITIGLKIDETEPYICVKYICNCHTNHNNMNTFTIIIITEPMAIEICNVVIFYSINKCWYYKREIIVILPELAPCSGYIDIIVITFTDNMNKTLRLQV